MYNGLWLNHQRDVIRGAFGVCIFICLTNTSSTEHASFCNNQFTLNYYWTKIGYFAIVLPLYFLVESY